MEKEYHTDFPGKRRAQACGNFVFPLSDRFLDFGGHEMDIARES